MGIGKSPRNQIGRVVARLRFERGWSQNDLAIQLQCCGVDVSRQTVARMELGHTKVSDKLIEGLQKVFRVPIAQLFSKAVQDLDEKFRRRLAEQSPEYASVKCQKLTRRAKPG